MKDNSNFNVSVSDINKITWEIEQYFEKIDVHTQEVSLIGFNGYGDKYSAFGILCCGEIEDVNDVELVYKSDRFVTHKSKLNVIQEQHPTPQINTDLNHTN